MNYTVEYDTNYDKFTRRVEQRLEDGWELQGGCCQNQGLFVQALTKKEPPAPPKRGTRAGAKLEREKTTSRRKT